MTKPFNRNWTALLAAVGMLMSSSQVLAEELHLADFWGKTQPDLVKKFPVATSEKDYLALENAKGWKKVGFFFDKKKLWAVFLVPLEPLTEAEAKKKVTDELGLLLPLPNEVRTPGMVAFRDMKGHINIINLIYSKPGAYQQISEISVFFSYN